MEDTVVMIKVMGMDINWPVVISTNSYILGDELL